MIPYWRILGVVGVALVISGCWIIEIRPRAPIPVPQTLSDDEAEGVLVYELLGQPLPVEFVQGERMTAPALKAFTGVRSQSAQTQRVWFLESVEPGLLTVGYMQGQFYLRVAMRIQQRGVSLRIVDSKNLSQEDNKIHEVALVWVDELETSIRRALGQAATVRRLGMERR